MLLKEELDSIKPMDCLCELNIERLPTGQLKYITINGVILDYKDFGVKEDLAPNKTSEGEDCYCGNMVFLPFGNIPKNILKKYNITLEEAWEIQNKLAQCLSFHECSWCI